MTIATIRHVAHTWLLLAPTTAMDHMTSDDRCYCGARGMRTVASSTHISDELSDISGPLLLSPTVATSGMTSGDHCYYWARGMCAVATIAHNSDGPYDIR
jgi:hypothetical protein